MNSFLTKLEDYYYNKFLDLPMDQCHINGETIDTGYALEGIELFINYIKEKEVEE